MDESPPTPRRVELPLPIETPGLIWARASVDIEIMTVLAKSTLAQIVKYLRGPWHRVGGPKSAGFVRLEAIPFPSPLWVGKRRGRAFRALITGLGGIGRRPSAFGESHTCPWTIFSGSPPWGRLSRLDRAGCNTIGTFVFTMGMGFVCSGGSGSPRFCAKIVDSMPDKSPNVIPVGITSVTWLLTVTCCCCWEGCPLDSELWRGTKRAASTFNKHGWERAGVGVRVQSIPKLQQQTLVHVILLTACPELAPSLCRPIPSKAAPAHAPWNVGCIDRVYLKSAKLVCV